MKISLILKICLLIISCNTHLFAESPCTQSEGGPVLASASTWDNLRNNENSIKFNIGKLIKSATEGKQKATFTIISKPNKLLTSYSDKKYCEVKEQETLIKKLTFSSPNLASTDDLNSWIADFSQGKGDAGEDLYAKCDKSCSPSYEYEISYSSTPKVNFKVLAKVICGHARDKDDNQYNLNLICK